MAASAPDAPLPPPPLLLVLPPPPPLLPLPLSSEPPPLPSLLEPSPPPPLRAAPVLPLFLAFLAGATPAAATLASVLPSAGRTLVAPRRLVPLPAARAEPTCVNKQAAPNRHVPFFAHCRHSPFRASAATVGPTVGWWTSAYIKPPLEIYAGRRGQNGPGMAKKAPTAVGYAQPSSPG